MILGHIYLLWTDEQIFNSMSAHSYYWTYQSTLLTHILRESPWLCMLEPADLSPQRSYLENSPFLTLTLIKKQKQCRSPGGLESREATTRLQRRMQSSVPKVLALPGSPTMNVGLPAVRRNTCGVPTLRQRLKTVQDRERGEGRGKGYIGELKMQPRSGIFRAPEGGGWWRWEHTPWGPPAARARDQQSVRKLIKLIWSIQGPRLQTPVRST